jgi:hypothetical protein
MASSGWPGPCIAPESGWRSPAAATMHEQGEVLDRMIRSAPPA